MNSDFEYDMTVQTKLHTTEDYPEFILREKLDREKRAVEGWLADGCSKGKLGALPSWADGLDDAFQLAFKLGKPEAEGMRYLRISLDCYVAYFKLCSNPGQWCDCEIDGHVFRKMGDENIADGFTSDQWGYAFDQALVLRDNAAIQVLSAVPESVIMRSYDQLVPGQGGMHFHHALQQLLQNLYNPEANHQQLFEALFAATEDHGYGSEQMFRYIFLPLGLLLMYIFSGDEARYQEAMQEALAGHRAHFMKDRDALTCPGGWIAMRICAMATLAFERHGWVVEYPDEYAKEYVPHWLITGQFD